MGWLAASLSCHPSHSFSFKPLHTFFPDTPGCPSTKGRTDTEQTLPLIRSASRSRRRCVCFLFQRGIASPPLRSTPSCPRGKHQRRATPGQGFLASQTEVPPLREESRQQKKLSSEATTKGSNFVVTPQRKAFQSINQGCLDEKGLCLLSYGGRLERTRPFLLSKLLPGWWRGPHPRPVIFGKNYRSACSPLPLLPPPEVNDFFPLILHGSINQEGMRAREGEDGLGFPMSRVIPEWPRGHTSPDTKRRGEKGGGREVSGWKSLGW